MRYYCIVFSALIALAASRPQWSNFNIRSSSNPFTTSGSSSGNGRYGWNGGFGSSGFGAGNGGGGIYGGGYSNSIGYGGGVSGSFGGGFSSSSGYTGGSSGINGGGSRSSGGSSGINVGGSRSSGGHSGGNSGINGGSFTRSVGYGGGSSGINGGGFSNSGESSGINYGGSSNRGGGISVSYGGGFSNSGGGGSGTYIGSSSSSSGYGGEGRTCPKGQLLNVDGTCAEPEVSKTVYVYEAPEKKVPYTPAPKISAPKVEYDIIFVRTKEKLAGAEPIVIPPPQRKTLVYVLSKKQQVEGQQIIEVPGGPAQKPEVFYVNYEDGENPQLPGGINLQDAINAAAQTGQLIESGNNAGGSNGGYSTTAPVPVPSYGNRYQTPAKWIY